MNRRFLAADKNLIGATAEALFPIIAPSDLPRRADYGAFVFQGGFYA
jgi:hypothetical protein